MKLIVLVCLACLSLVNCDVIPCPSSHPWAYFKGKYCCASQNEKVYKPQSYACDGGLIGLDSKCCKDDKYTPCPRGLCRNNDVMLCPSSHPFAYFSGRYCCATGTEKVYKPQGNDCDGGNIILFSKCCKDNKYIPCPNGACRNNDAILCPSSHPFAYFNGRYCCATKKEKVYNPQGRACDGGVIGLDSKCCKNDKYTPCPRGVCRNNEFSIIMG